MVRPACSRPDQWSNCVVTSGSVVQLCGHAQISGPTVWSCPDQCSNCVVTSASVVLLRPSAVYHRLKKTGESSSKILSDGRCHSGEMSAGHASLCLTGVRLRTVCHFVTMCWNTPATYHNPPKGCRNEPHHSPKAGYLQPV